MALVRVGAWSLAVLVAACGNEPALGGGGPGSGPERATAPSPDDLGTSTDLPDPTGSDGVGEGSGDSGPEVPVPDLGGPPGPAGPHFVDVTLEAGLGFDPGQLYSPPFCALDNLLQPGDGDYCTAERYLGAAAVGDYDGDDWPDVFFTRMDGPGLLMRNRGDGTFEDVTEPAGVVQSHITGAAAWLDVEGDGDLDLMMTGFGTQRHYLYVNDGTGHFDEQGSSHGVALLTGEVHMGTSIGVGDYDLDGYLDMFVAEWRPIFALGGHQDHNRLLHNLGAAAPGRFEDVTEAMGIDMQSVSEQASLNDGAYVFAPGFVDLDGDHWPELALAADFGTSRLFWNDGAGHLVDGTEVSGVASDAEAMGSTLGDYDGDGDLDWFVSAIYSEIGIKGNRMFRNDGARSFTDVTDDLGVRDGGWGWGASFFDLDHDGDLDLVMAAGWPSALNDDPLLLWVNDGAGPWPERAVELGIDHDEGGRGLVTFDYDRDGDLDLLVHTNTEPPTLFRNDGATGSWLQVRAVGQGGNSRSIGAEVRVQAQPGGPWQVRHIGVGSHLFGQEDAVAHFGLGAGQEPLYRVEIRWPASGRTQMKGDVARDQVLVVYE